MVTSPRGGGQEREAGTGGQGGREFRASRKAGDDVEQESPGDPGDVLHI